MEWATGSLLDSIEFWLFLAAVLAGLVDAIAGGGGLITVPSLLLAGVPPITALGTNRMQAVIGELTAFVTFLIHKQIPIHNLALGMGITAIGASLGSYAVTLFPKETLEILLPVLMIAITMYSIFSKKLQHVDNSYALLSSKRFMCLCGIGIGFYNGFFGPGTGSIWMLAFVILLGLTIKNASIATKPLNLIGNAVSLLVFVALGQVDYGLGLLMGAGQIFGSILGSLVVIKQGDKIVRPLFIGVTLLMTLKLLFEQWLS